MYWVHRKHIAIITTTSSFLMCMTFLPFRKMSEVYLKDNMLGVGDYTRMTFISRILGYIIDIVIVLKEHDNCFETQY